MAGFAVIAVAAATAAAVSVPLTVTGATSGHHRAFIPAPDDPRSDGQMIGFHGIVVTLPGSWHVNDTRCGTPVADTVIRDEGGSPQCVVRRPKGVSSVELRDHPASWATRMRHVADVTNGYGVHLRRGTVAGRGDAVVIVPTVGVVMFLNVSSAATAKRILDSVQIVETDTTGCAMREAALDPPSSSALRGGPFRHYTVRYVVPPSAASMAVCHYVDHWLASAATVTDSALTELVHIANTSPPGRADAQSSCDAASSAGSAFVLHAHYPGLPDLLLWAHLGNCGALGITNGLRSGQLSSALADAVTAPLHTTP